MFVPASQVLNTPKILFFFRLASTRGDEILNADGLHACRGDDININVVLRKICHVT